MVAPRRWLMPLLLVILLSGGVRRSRPISTPCHRLHRCPSDLLHACLRRQGTTVISARIITLSSQ